jgi:uncharacterized RDD family membrane protein YckC
MTCPVCGKASPCVHVRRNTSALVDHKAGHEVFAGDEPRSAAVIEAGSPSANQRPAAELAWRQEIVSRVQQHRARRRRPADPNALELDFSADSPYSFGAEPGEHALPPPPERFAEIMIPQNTVKQEPPKVIRFPRPQPAYVPTVEEVRLDELELAEPVLETPRIMEAFEPEAVEPGVFEPGPLPAYATGATALENQQMELLPSFADIRLEPEEARIDDDLDVIPRPAPLSRRFVSGLVDAGIVFIATGTFAFTFAELAEEMPQSRMMLVCMLAASGIFWLLFQYIFLTYRRATPGMRLAQLELCTFEGTPTSMFARQCRALACALSCFSIGLGYAWALVDEDRLGWHDRISQTHLRSLVNIPSAAREPYGRDEP